MKEPMKITSTIRLSHIPLGVSRLCLGTADWGAKHGDDLDELYVAFRNAGGNIFDTAHCYAFWMDAEGRSEQTLGEVVRRHDRRENVVICSKGCHITGGEKYPRPERYMTPEILEHDLTQSLDRLQTDYIDVYYLHRDDETVAVDEILDALETHKNAGRIRAYAASNWRASRLQQANEYSIYNGLSGFVASQILWNLGELSHPVPDDICAMNNEEMGFYETSKLPVFAFSGAANGFFGDTIPSQSSYDNEVSRARRERASQLAQKRGATTNQIALAYLFAHDFPVVAITGTTSIAHLSDALGATQIKLSTNEARWLHDG